MKLLADSSQNTCSLALWRAGTLLGQRECEQPNKQVEQMPLMLQLLLKEHLVSLDDVEELVVSLGPGSFSGVRIALTFFKAISLAKHLKCKGYSTLEMLAGEAKANMGESVAALINARRGEFYVQLFTMHNAGLMATSEPKLMACDQLASVQSEIIITNDELAKDFCEVTKVIPLQASLLGAVSEQETLKPHPLVPIYVRAADAKLPSKKSIL